MPRETTPKAIAAKAERQAIQLLTSRAEGIGDAAVLRHRIDQLAEEFNVVADQYATVLTKLRDNGWTDDELAKLGLTEVPTAGQNTGRRRPGRQATAPAPRSPEPAPTPGGQEDGSPTVTDGLPAPSNATPA